MSQKTLFSKTDGEINSLIDDIKNGDLALPELQRPFVWGNNRVRDLFDSMYQGYPIGYFLFWENDSGEKTNKIGNEEKANKIPKRLIIDGQQRLTALFCIIKNVPVKDKDYEIKKIKIAFNPISEEFRVTDAATAKNKEFISDISEVFDKDTWSFTNEYIEHLKVYREEVKLRVDEIVRKLQVNEDLKEAEYVICITRLNQIKDATENYLQLINKLKERKAPLLPNEDKKLLIDFLETPSEITEPEIGRRIARLSTLIKFPYQALMIVGDIDEEKVAEIFTRINSKGVSLSQGDFVLTLISVFWEEGRKEIDAFCKSAKTVPDSSVKDSPYNYVIHPDAQDIVRAIVGLKFKRARMKEAYAILKGRDPDTNKYSSLLREKQFDLFKEASKPVISNSNWQGFLKIVISLGYKAESLIASNSAVINSYIFFLIGKLEFNVDYKLLDRTIGRWFFMASLTSRYSGSSESIMESDLNKIKACKNADEFVKLINGITDSTLTNDFWDISLPNDLMVTSNPSSPVANAFFASLIYNNVNALFSTRKISDLFDPNIKIKKKSLDRHHIYPKDYLKTLSYQKIDINQIANLTYLEYLDNIKISATPPEKYFHDIKKKHYASKEDVLNQALLDHGIPKKFPEMEYDEFLKQRRKLMASLIRKAFDKI